MLSDHDLSAVIDIAQPHLNDFVARIRFRAIKILIVVDTEISLSSSPSSFGIERVIRLLRETKVGCQQFTVDIGRRSAQALDIVDNPVGTQPKYEGFRFNSQLPNGKPIINSYDEVWIFGFKPHAAFTPPSNDADIGSPNALPASDDELEVLSRWMNKRGGVFATGDHDFLGAPMASRIPRVGTMRAWTNAQNVPPISGTQRIDSNRPYTLDEANGIDVVATSRERDDLPQKIQWVPWSSFYLTPWLVRRRPHPVLCHPRLGPIDVMPDHPHEGVVFDHVAQPDVGLAAITLNGSYEFGSLSGQDYPTVNGKRPLPMVIAYGNTLADPPLQLGKGDSTAKKFGMISVYDGHHAKLGRVAVDSTWHHWMNMNISQLEATGGDNWEKIKRYYLNLAVWLAPPNRTHLCLHYHLVESLYTYPGIVEFHPTADTLQIGQSIRDRLIKHFGPCWVTQSILQQVFTVNADLHQRLSKRYLLEPNEKSARPTAKVCLTTPAPEMIESYLLGAMSKAVAAKLFAKGGVESSLKIIGDLDTKTLDKLCAKGVELGFQELQETYLKDMKKTQQLFG